MIYHRYLLLNALCNYLERLSSIPDVPESLISPYVSPIMQYVEALEIVKLNQDIGAVNMAVIDRKLMIEWSKYVMYVTAVFNLKTCALSVLLNDNKWLL